VAPACRSLTRALLVAGTLLSIASLVAAAPLPRPRANAAAPGRLQVESRHGIESACGTRLESGVEMVEAHAARPIAASLPTPHSTDAGEIAVLEDDGNFFFTDKSGRAIADLAAIGQSFYRTHGDDYDCLAVYLSTGLSTWLGSPNAIAAAFVLRNTIRGIGVDSLDVGGNMGSASRLQWMLSLNGLQRYPSDPNADIAGDTFSSMDVLGHEFGHRWLAYTLIDSAGTPTTALLGRDLQHWSFFFDSDSSLMEGGNWSPVAPDSFICDGLSNAYGNLDLYLMGLRSKANTPPFFTLHDATNFDPPGNYTSTSFATLDMTCHARAHFWSIDDLEAVNGPRVPDAASAPHSFRVGFILVVPRGQDASAADLAKLDHMRSLFPGYFSTLTQGLGAIDPTLDSRAGSVAIAHDPLYDRLDLDTPVPVTAGISIAQEGIPLTLDASSLRLFWRLGTSGAFSSLPMTATGAPDSFSASLPANPGYDGTVQYYLYAASDSTGIDAFDPPAGAAAPHAFAVGPDHLPPNIVHTPIAEQGEGQLPVTILARVTDNVALASVKLEWGVDGSISHLDPMTAVGRDSFALTIGGGLTNGHEIDYRIDALDTSGNSAVSESGLQGGRPWTLLIRRDWSFDTENSTGGLTHAPYWFSYLDAWHPTTESSYPSGGTAWKCGSEAPLPYPVHLDANLYLPPLDSVANGTQLRFAHRYALEENDATEAWDGARVEGQIGNGPWIPLNPAVPYSHVFLNNSNPFQAGTPCWSGSSNGWRTESVDLSPLAPGPARVRFRMLADDDIGFDGWLVDQIVVDFPDGTSAVPPLAAASHGPWPNPASDALRIQLVLPRAGRVEWALYDLAGRRVAGLTSREFAAGAVPLEAKLPRTLRAGVYLAKLSAPGVPPRVDRIAIVR